MKRVVDPTGSADVGSAFNAGGHLGLGQNERTRDELDAFLDVPVAV